MAISNNIQAGKIVSRASRRRALLAGAALLSSAGLHSAHAFDTTLGAWQVNIDTTLSSSVDIRTSPIDQRFVGVANGGKYSLANFDNGTLNFRNGSPVAATQRITTELQVKRDDYGIFVRATGFYDPITDSERTDFRQLSRAAVRDIGADLRLLDAYAFFRPNILNHPFDVRIGAQALNWGESTFIQFGINSINPLDATALRTPGSELRQGFLPIPVVDVKTDIGDGFSLEGFWQFSWTRTKLEPVGSFFGNGDTIFDGGTFGNLFNYFPDNAKSVYGIAGLPGSFNGKANPGGDLFGGAFPRSVDRHPNTPDEFGFALRKSFASLGDTELGLYFENYHSRTPFGSFHTGSANAVFPQPFPAILFTQGYATKTYTSTASTFADYPKDIHLVGISYNFTGPAGVAIQGEVSSRINQPIQLSASDLALAANYPAILAASKALPLPALLAALAEANANPTIKAAGFPGFDQIIDGWKRYPVIQAQTTATKLFNAIPSLAINQIVLVGEIGGDYVVNFPRDRGIFNAPYTTDTNSAYSEAGTVDALQPLSKKGFASQFSAAYTVATIVDMPNVLPYGIDMKPTISLQHDFIGTSPVGVNTFVQNTAAASFGVTFNYLQAFSLGVQYTNHFPVFDGGKHYGLIDRDFASAVLSYEF